MAEQPEISEFMASVKRALLGINACAGMDIAAENARIRETLDAIAVKRQEATELEATIYRPLALMLRAYEARMLGEGPLSAIIDIGSLSDDDLDVCIANARTEKDGHAVRLATHLRSLSPEGRAWVYAAFRDLE